MPTLGAELAGDVLGSAVGAVPALLGFRLFAAAFRTEFALDVLCPALRAVPASLRHSIAYSLSHLLCGVHNGIQSILGHAYHAAHGSQGHAQARNVSQATDCAAVSGDAVLHGLQAYLPGGLLLVGVALHAHFLRLCRRLHPVSLGLRLLLDFQGLSVPLCPDDLHSGGGLGLYGLTLGLRRGDALANLLLPDVQVGFRKLLLHPPEIGVIVRGHYTGHIEFRHFQTVFRKLGIDPLPQSLGKLHQSLVNFQYIDGVLPDHRRKITLYLGHNHGAEQALAAAAQKRILPQLPGGAHQLYKQLPGIHHPNAEFAGGPQLYVHPRHGVKQPHLGIRAPFDAHLGGEIDKVDLAVEGSLGICWQLVELFQNGQLLGFQGIPPRPEQVQCLSVPEEDGLLAFVDNELRAQVEVLNGVFPDQSLVVTFVLDNTCQTVLLDLLGLDPLRHIIHMVADRAYVRAGPLSRPQPHTALAAGEFHGLILLHHGVDGFPADGALGIFALALVKDHLVAAVRALAAYQLVCADIDGVAAGAVDFLSCEEAGFGLHVAPTVGAFDYKFGHKYLLHFLPGRPIGHTSNGKFFFINEAKAGHRVAPSVEITTYTVQSRHHQLSILGASARYS